MLKLPEGIDLIAGTIMGRTLATMSVIEGITHMGTITGTLATTTPATVIAHGRPTTMEAAMANRITHMDPGTGIPTAADTMVVITTIATTIIIN